MSTRHINYLHARLTIPFMLSACLLCPAGALHAENVMQAEALETLSNVLRSQEDRQSALGVLMLHPDNALRETLIDILHNNREPIPFRHTMADALKRIGDDETRRSLRRTLFNRKAKDLFVRKASLSIVLALTPDIEKPVLLNEILDLAQNNMDLPDMREYAIGYLLKTNFISEKEPAWASQLVKNMRESVSVRTAALTYMETMQYNELITLIPTLITQTNEDRNFREILMLKAAYLYHENVTQAFRSILSSQREPYWVRHLALNLLQDEFYADGLDIFLLQIWKREKDEKMQTEMKEAIEVLKSRN